MLRRSALVVALLLPLAATAEERPPVDADAIEEALGGGTPDRYASSRAYVHYLDAQLADAAGNTGKAIEALRLALIYDEGSAEIRVALAWLLARTDDLPGAVEQVRKAIELEPRSAEAHLLLGKIRSAQRRKAEAVASLERSISLDGAQPEAWLALVRLQADFGEKAAAETVAKRYAKAHPGSGEAWRILADVALSRGEARDARKFLRLAATSDTGDVESVLKLAALEERRGRIREAAAGYERALTRDPDHAAALLGGARAALALGDEAGARAYLLHLLGISRDAIAGHLQAALIWQGARRFDEALALLADAEKHHPDEPRIAYYRGVVLESASRFAAAVEAYRKVPVDAGELHVTASARAADCLSLDGRHEEAIRTLGQAIGALARGRHRGAAGDVYGVLPDVYRRAGRAGEAVKLLEKAAGDETSSLAIALARSLQYAGRPLEAVELLAGEALRSPGEPRVVFALASARERAGDVDGAVALMQALLRTDPENASALNFIGYVWADRGVRLSEARKLLERALRLRPDEPDFLDSLGWCELKLGNARRGLELLQRAAALSPHQPVILHHLAEAYARSGRRTDALATWSQALRALERDPDPEIRADVEERLRSLQATR